ncbi:MAG: GNAT family N-acetyltransferase [Candidatus Freyarchaeota archaeon]
MQDVHVREYRVEDGDEVEKLFPHHTGKRLRKATSFFYKRALDGKPPDDVVAVVAVVNGRVVGFSEVRLVGETETEYPVTIVHETFRNRGIGKMLMRKSWKRLARGGSGSILQLSARGT